MAGFEFLRPGWLVVLPVVLAVVGWLWFRAGRVSAWREHGDPAFVEHVLGPVPGRGWLGWSVALVVGSLCVVALAGPSWERSLITGMRPAHTRIVVLDLSQSMNAQDVAPSRLGLAVGKARAILEQSRGMQVGMAVFAGASFLVAPLTSDANTLLHHLDVMDPSLIPVQGSRPDMGLEAAGELLNQGGALTGEVVLISDGYRGQRAAEAAAVLWQAGFPVSVIGVGTEGDVRIPTETGPLRGLNGKVVSAPAFLAGLRSIAAAGGGRFAVAGESDDDVETVLLSPDLWASSVDDPDRRLSVPKDGGPWLLLAVLPLAALGFRRGWLLVVALTSSLAVVEPVQAAWHDFLKGPDFRAAQALAADDPETASRLARDPMIAGAAFYRLGRYALAAAAFEQADSALAHYNRGNALAHMGKLRDAVAAYDHALSRDLGFNEARLNRALIAKLIVIEEAKREPDESPSEAPSNDDSSGETRERPGEREPPPQRETTEQKAAETPAGQTNDGYQSALRAGGPVREIPEGASGSWNERRRDEWLSQIPDDPGSLLKQKFRIEFEKRRWRRVQNTDRW
jgi:Ca-activated chloride channel family protein